MQRKSDREAGGAERGKEGGGLDAELAQRGDASDDQHAVARGRSERRPRRLVDPTRLRKPRENRARDPPGEQRACEQDEKRQQEPRQQCLGDRRGEGGKPVESSRDGGHARLSHEFAGRGASSPLAISGVDRL